MHTETDVFWERDCRPAAHWQHRFPNIWRLQQQFQLKILQRLITASAAGATDFVLASETRCFNGLNTIACVYYLSPAFSQLQQLEAYLAENLLAVLYEQSESGVEPLAFCGSAVTQAASQNNCSTRCSALCSYKYMAFPKEAPVKVANF